METIPEITKEIRKKLNMSQEKFGDAIGVTKQTVSLWETGVTTPEFTLLLAFITNTKDWRREWALRCYDVHPRKVVVE